jgi:PHD/YefM family antitoxin component YafN of YafNO toxin-antitoxin module
MKTITAGRARVNLYRLIEETADSGEPVLITGKRTNAVLVLEEVWRAIQEITELPQTSESDSGCGPVSGSTWRQRRSCRTLNCVSSRLGQHDV